MAGLGDDLVYDFPGEIVYEYPTVNTPGSAGPGTSGSTAEPSFLDIVKQALTLTPPLLAAKQTYDLNQLNMDRVARGLAPLTAQQMAAMSPQVNVGLASAQADMLKYALIGLGIFGAIALFKPSRK